MDDVKKKKCIQVIIDSETYKQLVLASAQLTIKRGKNISVSEMVREVIKDKLKVLKIV